MILFRLREKHITTPPPPPLKATWSALILTAFGKTITKVEYVQYVTDVDGLSSEMLNAQNDWSCFVLIM